MYYAQHNQARHSRRETAVSTVGIYTMDGNELTVGLQGSRVSDEAIHAAQRSADLRGEDVLLVDDDGEWIVHPLVGGRREPADPYDG